MDHVSVLQRVHDIARISRVYTSHRAPSSAAATPLGPVCVVSEYFTGLQDLVSHKLRTLQQTLLAATDCLDVRMMFFMNELSERDAKEELERRERQRTHLQQVYNCLVLVRDVGLEAIQHMLRHSTIEAIDEGLRQLNEVVSFSNTQLAELGRVNKLAVPHLDGALLRHCHQSMFRQR